uniref:SWIM-type domain-containing protein n=1 Tax=Lactuca sativa TaxID=4236 RepID=A0A9R1XGF9_LACSA|nr:hypothetical protein LSAT_V11C500244150 [Lactuca sativa]
MTDSDWVNAENIIPEVEVDMRDFHMSIDNEAEFFEKILRNSMEKDRSLEHEDMKLDVIDNDEWDSTDDDYEMGKKRRYVIKELGKGKRCSLGEVHKPTFRTGQKYKSKKELKDKIAHHALETRKNLFIKKNDKLRLQATCKGKVVLNEGQVDGPTTGKKSKGKSKKTKTNELLMKGAYPGQILTAVGLDSNNGICPLATIVESENTQSWKWFLEYLGDDLDLSQLSNITFISDRQKPLHSCSQLLNTDSVLDISMKTGGRDGELLSTKIGRPITDMLLNNLCEVFNSKLIEGSDKPIITCLEYIQEYMMKRICNVIKVQQKCVGPLTPTTTKIMETNTTNASNYIASWNSSNKYEVQGPWQDQHVVDMGQRVCSYRKWELTRIPCRHVIAVLFDKVDNGEDVGELYTYVHKVHWLETWKDAYSYKVEPIKGRSMWPVSDCPMKISPPPHRNQPGRPKKKRQRSMEEKSQSWAQSHSQTQIQSQIVVASGIDVHGPGGSGKLTRKFITVTCSKCKNKGHKARTFFSLLIDLSNPGSIHPTNPHVES